MAAEVPAQKDSITSAMPLETRSAMGFAEEREWQPLTRRRGGIRGETPNAVRKSAT
jgi:hypothetical protein